MCEEKKRLLGSFDDAATAHSRLISALNEQLGTMTKKFYLESRRNIETMRLQMEQARQDLDRHVTEHRY
jgi:hypothetical protein